MSEHATAPVAESNEQILRQIIDTKPTDLKGRLEDYLGFMDPDSARFIDWMWLHRQNNGKDTAGTYVRIPKEANVEWNHIKDSLREQFPILYYSETVIRGLTYMENGNDTLIDSYVIADISSEGEITVNVFGNPAVVDDYSTRFSDYEVLKNHFTVETLDGFSDSGPIVSRDQLRFDEVEVAYDEWYPFLQDDQGNPMTVQQFVDAYRDSNASAVVLVGPPGTGKTTLLRTLCAQLGMENNIVVSSEAAILSPSLIPWIRGHGRNTFVGVEDADNLVKKREDGNKAMSALLNFADGVTRNQNKLVVSTNLPSTRDIDPALLRRGRTFMVVKFRLLTGPEINAVRARLGKEPFDLNGLQDMTLSDALNSPHGIYTHSDRQGAHAGIGFSA